MKLRTLLAAALVTTCAAVSSQAQTLTSIYLNRGQDNVQTDATTRTPDPTPVSATYGGPLSWGISVRGTGLSAPTVTLPGATNNGTLNPTQHNGGVLGYNADEGAWQYGSPHFNNIGFPVAGGGADRNARFPLGTYTIDLSASSLANVSLTYANPVAPDAPLFTLTGGTWSNGAYLVNPTQAVTITSSAFGSYLTGNVNGALNFGIYDSNGDALAGSESLRFRSDATPGNNFISYTILANTLTLGQDYSVNGTFVHIVDQNTTNGGTNFAFFAGSTSLTITAVPEPSTYAMFAGLGALGLVAWRRRSARLAV